MTRERKIYEPGVYDISNDEYHSSAGISRTGIMEFKKTPKHFWHRYYNPNFKPKEKTDSLDFGGAFHPYILEREKFEKEFFIAEKNPYHGSSTAGKEFKANMKLKSAGRTLIDAEDFDLIQSMAHSIDSNPEAKGLITDAKYEQSIYWIDPETQLLCKCRPDIWHDDFIVDLKTTKDASSRPFQMDFYRYGYHLQIGMIHEGIKHTQNKEIKSFIDIAVEKVEPYCTAIYLIDDLALQHGIEEFHYHLVRIKDAIENNHWPSYPTQTLSVPTYATIGE